MSFDVVSVSLLAGSMSAVWFFSKAERAEKLRRRLPEALRGRGMEDPFYPFRRWTWSGVPGHWVTALLTSVVSVFVFGGMAVWV